MFPDTKIVQAEGRTKFIWDLPRRRLSKRRLVLRKVCKPSAKANLFGICRGAAYLSGGLSSAKCASRVQNRIYLGFCRSAAYLSGGLSSAKCASRVQKQPAIGNLRIKIRNSVPSSRGCVRIGCCRSCGSKSAEHAPVAGLRGRRLRPARRSVPQCCDRRS